MSIIRVTVEQTDIIINNGEKIKFPIANILDIDGKKYTGYSSDKLYNRIKGEQEFLNYLDCIKDGKEGGLDITAKLNSLEMFKQKIGQCANTGNCLDKIKEIRKNITHNNNGYFRQQTWTKTHKGCALDPPLDYDKVTRDAGISEERIIKPTQVGTKLKYNTVGDIGTYIDPATRNLCDEVFPDVGTTLIFEPSFMDLFGLGQNSRIDATAKTRDDSRFGYVFEVDNYGKIEYNGKSILKDDPNKGYFAGNATKNGILKQAAGNNQARKEQCKIIMSKEWGDKIQVLCWFVYSQINSNFRTTMITCDMTVLALCVMLGVNCIFSNATPEIKTEQRMNCIEIYESKPLDIPIMINKYIEDFNKEKALIFEENKKFKSVVELLQENPDQTLYIGDQPYVFPPSFYENIKKDIDDIQGYLETFTINTNRSENMKNKEITENSPINTSDPGSKQIIKDRIRVMKEWYLVQNFIKSSGNGTKIIITQTNKYTSRISTSYTNVNDSGRSASFYEMGVKFIEKSYPRSDRPTTLFNIGSKRPRHGGAKDLTKNPIVLSTEFEDDSDATMYTMADINMYQNLEETKIGEPLPKYGLYATLKNDVETIIVDLAKDKMYGSPNTNLFLYFDAIYSCILLDAYINNSVYSVDHNGHTTTLYERIKNIMDHQIDYKIYPVEDVGNVVENGDNLDNSILSKRKGDNRSNKYELVKSRKTQRLSRLMSNRSPQPPNVFPFGFGGNNKRQKSKKTRKNYKTKD